MPYTLELLPTRKKLRVLHELPSCIQSRIDIEDAKRAMPMTEKLEPNHEK